MLTTQHTTILILSLSVLVFAGLWLAWIIPSLYRAIRR